MKQNVSNMPRQGKVLDLPREHLFGKEDFVPRRLAVVYRPFIGGRQAIAENFQGSGRVELIADSVYTICFAVYEMQHSSQQCVPMEAAHIDIHSYDVCHRRPGNIVLPIPPRLDGSGKRLTIMMTRTLWTYPVAFKDFSMAPQLTALR